MEKYHVVKSKLNAQTQKVPIKLANVTKQM